MPREEAMKCPKCGGECWRDEVHVGVGWMYGPYGCPECYWSESSEYDRSEGKVPPGQPEGWYTDNFGRSMRIEAIVERCKHFGLPEQPVRDAFKE